MTTRIPPYRACQPTPPPREARTAAMNRNARPKNSVPSPGPAADRAPRSCPGSASAVRNAPAYSAIVPRRRSQTTRKARPAARTATSPSRGSRAAPARRAAAPPKTIEEDPDPRQPRPAILVPAPRPAVGPDRPVGAAAPRSDIALRPSVAADVGRPARVYGPAGSAAVRRARPTSPSRRRSMRRESSSSSTWLNPSRSANRPSGPGAHQFQRPMQPHRRRDEQDADDRRVDEDRDRHADADALDRDRLGEGERREHRDHDQRRAGDHAGGLAPGPRRRTPCCRRSGGTPPGSATGAGPRSPSTGRTGR